MHYYLLSTRATHRVPSIGVAVELEDLLVKSLEAQLLVPQRFPQAPRYRLPGTVRLPGSASDRVLIVIALWTGLLEILHAIPRWRRTFGRVVAYVIDPWGSWTDWPAGVTRDLDVYLVPDIRVSQRFREVHGVRAEAMAMAADVLRFGCNRTERPLDLVAYGRQNAEYLREFEQSFNDPRSSRFLYHDTLTGLEVKDFASNRRLIWKLLHKARCALSFDVLATPEVRLGDRQRSIIPIRYYEAITAGSAIVGRHPIVPEMQTDFDWPDATITLPDSPADSVTFLEGLLADSRRLAEIHRRNHEEAWKRHDWRYRVRDMLGRLELSLPPTLARELELLQGPPVGCENIPW